MASESGKIEILAPSGESIVVGAVACKIDTSAKAPKLDSKKPARPAGKETVQEEKIESKPVIKDSEENTEYKDIKVSPVAQKLMQENNINIEDVIKGLKRIGKYRNHKY
jgi:2-oxoglutarate dehydrogenase E2 component (dihydrolipoamide succinyltransferase)